MKKLNKLKGKKIALTFAILSSICSMSFAAETNMDEYSGEEYVVTATKTKLEAKEVPVPVEVITESKIKELGAYSVQDALRLSSNVDVQDNGMTGNQVMLRGSSTMHTLILIDGKRMAQENTQSSQNAYELKRINIADVERIEVIRGNSSALYGSDAMGGVINIITKKATTPSFSVDMHTGTKDEAVNLMYSSGKQGKTSIKLGGGIEKIRCDNSGIYNNITSSGNTEASTTNMYGTRRFLNTGLAYDFDAKHSLDFSMNFMREQLRSNSWNSMGTDYTQSQMTTLLGFIRKNALAGGAPPMVVNSQMFVNSLLKQGYTMEQLNATMPDPTTIKKYPMEQPHFYNNNRSDFSLSFNGSDGKHDYNIRTYYSQLRKDNTSWYKNLQDKTQRMVDFDSNNYKQFVLEAKDTYNMDQHNTITWGAEFKKDIMDGTHLKDAGSKLKQLTVNGITKASSEVNVNTSAIYIQDQIKLGEKLNLIPAVRLDHHETFGSYASPKIGATYKLSNNARLKMNWGKGFRAPTLYELYAQMEKIGMAPMPVNVIGNPDLKPEKSNNFDISLEAEKGKANTKASFYHNKIKNMIDSGDYDPVKLAQNIIWTQYINRDSVEINGAEFEIGYNFNRNWNLRGSYNYIDAKDQDTKERLLYRARQNGLLQLSYTDAKLNPLSINLYTKFFIDYHQSNTADYRHNYTFSTTGLVVTKQFHKNFRAYAGIDNLFDKKFHYDTYNTYMLDGRTWRLGVEMKF